MTVTNPCTLDGRYPTLPSTTPTPHLLLASEPLVWVLVVVSCLVALAVVGLAALPQLLVLPAVAGPVALPQLLVVLPCLVALPLLGPSA